MDQENLTVTRELLDYIHRSPTAFQAVENTAAKLRDAGFICLSEQKDIALNRGGRYYITRNASSLIAFTLPEAVPIGFMVTASHSDSPTFKLKPSYELESGGMLKLDSERYGGMILSSWLDRPLSLAGRAIVRTDSGIASTPFDLDRDIAVIPNTAIHLNRAINDGYRYDPARDLFPLAGEASDRGKLTALISESIGCQPDELLSFDAYLYNRTPGTLFGLDNEFFASPRIDDLQSAYATLMAFLKAQSSTHVTIYCLFDNEETGSTSRQGAASPFFKDVLSLIADSLSLSGVELNRMLASSMMLSADNAHALHPNHPELSDPLNAPRMNNGVVIKYNANQKYTTDALSAAIFSEICAKAGVPVQTYANRSDLPGGSTLGNIASTQIAMLSVDIGLAQLAMHSSYETAGTADTLYMIRAVQEFYTTDLRVDSDRQIHWRTHSAK